jgi:hypothetical protein
MWMNLANETFRLLIEKPKKKGCIVLYIVAGTTNKTGK